MIPGILIGVLAFIVFGYLAINNLQQSMEPDFLRKNYIWILVFVFANGFMEEFIFRGIFLKKLDHYMKPVWPIILTSIIFAAPHLTVKYTPDVFMFFGVVFVLGMICGYAMYLTQNLAFNFSTFQLFNFSTFQLFNFSTSYYDLGWN